MLGTFLLALSVVCCTGVLGNHIVKRSDDTNPLQVAVNKLVQDLSTLQAEFQALKNTVAQKAAFRATLGKDRVSVNAPIPFTLQTMVGGGYDQNTGVYTAPYSGWYTFQFHLYSHDTAAFDMDLFKNGQIMSRALCHNALRGFSCSSGATFHLNAGDKVWVQSDYGGPYYHADFDDVLSGALVFGDD